MNILNKMKSKKGSASTESRNNVPHVEGVGQQQIPNLVEPPQREQSQEIIRPPVMAPGPRPVANTLADKPRKAQRLPTDESQSPIPRQFSVNVAPSLPRRSGNVPPINQKGPPPTKLVDQYLSPKDRTSQSNLFGTVIFWELLMDVYLLKLLNYDGRVLYLNIPESDLDDVDEVQYLCVKGAALYSCQSRDYAAATKREIVRSILKDGLQP